MVTSGLCSAPCSPHYSILGRISDTDVYKDVAEYEMVTAPGVGQELPAMRGQFKACPVVVHWKRGWGNLLVGREAGRWLHPWGRWLHLWGR